MRSRAQCDDTLAAASSARFRCSMPMQLYTGLLVIFTPHKFNNLLRFIKQTHIMKTTGTNSGARMQTYLF